MQKLLDPLPGAVCQQWRVYKGRKLGPYYFRFWRENRQLRKEYIRRAHLETVRRACAAYRQESQKQREDMILIRQLGQMLRARGL